MLDLAALSGPADHVFPAMPARVPLRQRALKHAHESASLAASHSLEWSCRRLVLDLRVFVHMLDQEAQCAENTLHPIVCFLPRAFALGHPAIVKTLAGDHLPFDLIAAGRQVRLCVHVCGVLAKRLACIHLCYVDTKHEGRQLAQLGIPFRLPDGAANLIELAFDLRAQARPRSPDKGRSEDATGRIAEVATLCFPLCRASACTLPVVVLPSKQKKCE